LDSSSQVGNLVSSSAWQAYGSPGEQDPSIRKRNDLPIAQKRKRRQPDKEGTSSRGLGGRVSLSFIAEYA
jgi:hypothetical protein